MIRDGGSLALAFHSREGSRYILFIQIRLEPGFKRLGYEPPVIIDCDPARRPANTARAHYSEMGGPRYRISWSDARLLIAVAKPHLRDLLPWRQKWLDYMVYVTDTEGKVPPDFV